MATLIGPSGPNRAKLAVFNCEKLYARAGQVGGGGCRWGRARDGDEVREWRTDLFGCGKGEWVVGDGGCEFW